MLKLIQIIGVVLSCFAVNQLLASPYQQLYIFGDSLSDNGKLSSFQMPPPPYFQGRATNGKVWAEYLSEMLNSTQNNYAYVGAKTDSTNVLDSFVPNLAKGLQEQVDDYFSNNTINQNGLYIIWAGSNDALDFANTAVEMANNPLQLATKMQKTIATSISNLKTVIDKLSNARYLVVIGLPNLGLTPRASVLGQTASYAITTFSDQFNQSLKELLKNYPAVYVDIFQLLQEITKNYLANGFTNTTDACVIATNWVVQSQCNTPETYLFWDDVHPTTITHKLVAQYVYQAINWTRADLINGIIVNLPSVILMNQNNPTGEIYRAQLRYKNTLSSGEFGFEIVPNSLVKNGTNVAFNNGNYANYELTTQTLKINQLEINSNEFYNAELIFKDGLFVLPLSKLTKQ
jgi:phospholipase/lecithinase/hemolysin